MKLKHEIIKIITDYQQPLMWDEKSLICVIIQDYLRNFIRFVFGKLRRDPFGIAKLVDLDKGESAEAFRLVPIEALLLFNVFIEDRARGQGMRDNAFVKLPWDGLKIERLLAW